MTDSKTTISKENKSLLPEESLYNFLVSVFDQLLINPNEGFISRLEQYSNEGAEEKVIEMINVNLGLSITDKLEHSWSVYLDDLADENLLTECQKALTNTEQNEAWANLSKRTQEILGAIAIVHTLKAALQKHNYKDIFQEMATGEENQMMLGFITDYLNGIENYNISVLSKID